MYKTLFILLISSITFSQTLTSDNTFAMGTGIGVWQTNTTTTTTVRKILVQPDNKIIVVGQFKQFNGVDKQCIVRLNVDGSIDTTFNVGTGANSGIWDCILQPNGKIIICGGFSNYNGYISPRLVRLNSNGTFDSSFEVGSGINYYVRRVAIQPDGKIIAVGDFQSYNGIARSCIVRINSDGSIDSTFNIGTGANQRINDVIIQPDGKIIIVGEFTQYNGTLRRYIARLNSNGSLDTSYDVGTGAFNIIWDAELLPDNKLLIVGKFQSYNGIARNRVARINTDGSLDTTFSVGTGANSDVMYVISDSDNKIYIGGSFTSFNSSTRNKFARLNENGSIDSSVTLQGTGFDETIDCIAKQSNKIIVGGSFTTYNGISKSRINRLEGLTLNNEENSLNPTNFFPNPTTGLVFIDGDLKFDYYELYDVTGKLLLKNSLEGNTIELEKYVNGVYFLKLFSNNNVTTKKIIKK